MEDLAQRRFVSVGECMIEMARGSGHQYTLGYAGDTLNTAWYMRAFSQAEWAVDYFTALGQDRYSNDIKAFLHRNGIGTRFIRTVRGRKPGLYLIHQQDGDRHFTYWRDHSAATLLADDKAVLSAALHGAGLVYFSGITLAILKPRAREWLFEALHTARDAGAKIAFDPNARPSLWASVGAMRTVLTSASSLCDFVLPTHSDDASVFGDASIEETAYRYLRLGVGEVVVKDGGNPALIATAREQVRVETQPATVVDATGAGDSFNGAYLSARLSERPIRDAAEIAHRVARIVIQQHGALIDFATLRRLLPF